MNSQLSMIEVTEQLMLQKKKPQNINCLIKEVLEIKGYDDDPIKKAQLYIDITTSAKFVYCGENEAWDLKERQSLELWDKDGSFFNSDDVVEEEEDDITVNDYNLDDDDVVDDDDDEEEEEEKIQIPEEEEDESSWDEEDEEKYNDMMDDYEDLYDDK